MRIKNSIMRILGVAVLTVIPSLWIGCGPSSSDGLSQNTRLHTQQALSPASLSVLNPEGALSSTRKGMAVTVNNKGGLFLRRKGSDQMAEPSTLCFSYTDERSRTWVSCNNTWTPVFLYAEAVGDPFSMDGTEPANRVTARMRAPSGHFVEIRVDYMAPSAEAEVRVFVESPRARPAALLAFVMPATPVGRALAYEHSRIHQGVASVLGASAGGHYVSLSPQFPAFSGYDVGVKSVLVDHIKAGRVLDAAYRNASHAGGLKENTVAVQWALQGSSPVFFSVRAQWAASSPVVGNSRLDGYEECDDGNAVPGDGCNAAGLLEESFYWNQDHVDCFMDRFDNRCMSLGAQQGHADPAELYFDPVSYRGFLVSGYVLWPKTSGRRIKVLLRRQNHTHTLIDRVLSESEFDDWGAFVGFSQLFTKDTFRWPDGNQAGGLWRVEVLDPSGDGYVAGMEVHILGDCPTGYVVDENFSQYWHTCCTPSTPADQCVLNPNVGEVLTSWE